MTAIVTRTVYGSGPYAYRVESDGTDPQGNPEQNWEYLGPVGKVDTEELTNDEMAELREEGFALARFRDNVEAEFAHLDIAQAAREDVIEQFNEDVLAPTDKRNSATVELAEDAPRAAVRTVTDAASDDRAEAAQGHGQSELKESEKAKIDFSKEGNNTFKAMTVKAGLLDKGINDWTQYYTSNETAEEIVNEASVSDNSGGRRTDHDSDEEGIESSNTSFEEAQSKMEEEAIQGAREGYEEARDVLVSEHGWTDAEADEVLAT